MNALPFKTNTSFDVITQPLYHYRTFESHHLKHENRWNFLHIPVGQSDTELAAKNLEPKIQTHHDTNMYLSGMLPSGNAFLLQAIRFLIVTGWGAGSEEFLEIDALRKIQRDWQRISTVGSLKFVIGSRRFLNDGPLCKFPTCFHTPQPFQNKCTELRNVRDRLLARHFTHVLYEVMPLYIEANQPFCLELDLPALPGLFAPVRMGPILDGKFYRQVY